MTQTRPPGEHDANQQAIQHLPTQDVRVSSPRALALLEDALTREARADAAREVDELYVEEITGTWYGEPEDIPDPWWGGYATALRQVAVMLRGEPA